MDKYIDEDWKESVAQEKEKCFKEQPGSAQDNRKSAPQESSRRPSSQGRKNQSEGTETDFMNYVTSLVYQAMIFLGEIPNPMDNSVERNTQQAKLMIDILIMLREKTTGNLTEREIDVLNTSIYELQMKYIELTQNVAREQP